MGMIVDWKRSYQVKATINFVLGAHDATIPPWMFSLSGSSHSSLNSHSALLGFCFSLGIYTPHIHWLTPLTEWVQTVCQVLCQAPGYSARTKPALMEHRVYRDRQQTNLSSECKTAALDLVSKKTMLSSSFLYIPWRWDQCVIHLNSVCPSA